MDRQPDRARFALTTINEVSKQALAGLRTVLGVLVMGIRMAGADGIVATRRVHFVKINSGGVNDYAVRTPFPVICG